VVRGDEIQMSAIPMTVTHEGNVILVPVEIRTSDMREIQEALERLRALQGQAPGVKQFAGSTEAIDLLDAESVTATSKFDLSMQKWMQKSGLDSADMAQFMMFMKSPAAGILRVISANPYVMAVLLVAMIAPQIWDWMTDKGRPISLFFERHIESEANVGRTREQRAQIRAGFRQVIVLDSAGFESAEDAFNSFEVKRDGDIETIAIFQNRSPRPI